MDGWLISIARVIGAMAGAFAGIVAVQLMRMRRMDFLPGWPGFWINHVVHPRHGAPRTPRLRLAVLGDSTTVGVGVDHPEHALPYLIAQRIADAESRDVHVVSYGWAGARVADLVRSQLPRALEPLRASETEPFLPGADYVAVVIGANDATHNTPRGRFRADLRTTLAGVRHAAPTARVVLAGIPAFRGALPGLEPLIFLADQYARLLRPISRAEAAQVGVAYADLQSNVGRLVEGRQDVLSSDRFHPSVVGYDAWAEVIFEALQSNAASADASVTAAGA
ncbi:MAG: GDSL-type esterase/lipase family protein [Chloroflexi bacterium]|nr:GDSL-type esterase/lipase family protein [Chloroflexota bacterium]